MPRHPLDPLSLVLGLGFLALGIAGLGTWIDIRHADGDWITPVVLVMLGLAIVASILSRSAGAPSDLGNRPAEPGVGEGSGPRDP
jgi:hypothetical protein